MALTQTTLSAAVAVDQNFIVVASAAGFAAGNYILIDQEVMLVQSSYVSGTTIPVVRGKEGTATSAHVVTAKVKTYLGSDSTGSAAQTLVTYPYVRATLVQSITATSTLTLPPPGCDLRVTLNGTSVITLTVPVPTTDMDGCLLTIVGNGAAAHVLTFTGGFSGAGTSYDVITVNATAPIAVQAIACNAVWVALAAVPLAGTVTNITGTVS